MMWNNLHTTIQLSSISNNTFCSILKCTLLYIITENISFRKRPLLSILSHAFRFFLVTIVFLTINPCDPSIYTRNQVLLNNVKITIWKWVVEFPQLFSYLGLKRKCLIGVTRPTLVTLKKIYKNKLNKFKKKLKKGGFHFLSLWRMFAPVDITALFSNIQPEISSQKQVIK